jgi:hypothetical protein
MFLKCFPELYEKLALKHSPNLDVNLCRKANTYFANCFYVPFEKDSLLKQAFHCRSCKAKFKNFFDLIEHQRAEHDSHLKTMFESSDALATVEKSPIGYLRCDPFALMLNLYWDLTLVVDCKNCNKRFLRGAYEKHNESCGKTSGLDDSKNSTDRLNLTKEDDVIKDEPVENVSNDEIKWDKQKRTRISSNRSLDTNNVVSDKRRAISIQSQFAAENFVFFGGSATNNVGKTREKKIKQITVVSNTSTPAVLVVKKEDSSNQDALVNNQSPLLASALTSYEATNADKPDVDAVSEAPVIKRRRKRRSAIQIEAENAAKERPLVIDEDLDGSDKVAEENDQHQPGIRVSRRIKKLSLKKMEADFDNAIMAATAINTPTSKHHQNDSLNSDDKPKKKHRISSLDSVNSTQQKMDVSIVSTDEASSDSDDLNPTRKKIKQEKPEIDGMSNGCEVCGLVFTSANSVVRHREKSCVGMPIVNIPSNDASNPKKKCPICQRIFFNTHSISIHIQKHHGAELGLAGSKPSVAKNDHKQVQETTDNQVEKKSYEKPKLVIKLKSTNKYYKPKKTRFQKNDKNKIFKRTPTDAAVEPKNSFDNSSTSVTHISDLSISSLSMSNNTEETQAKSQTPTKPTSGSSFVFVDDEDVNNKKFIGIRLCPYCNGQFRIKLKYKKHMPLCESKHRKKMEKANRTNFNLESNDMDLKQLFEPNSDSNEDALSNQIVQDSQ